MRRRQWFLVIFVLTAAAGYTILPDQLNLLTHVSPDGGDSMFTTWTMEHTIRRIFTDPSRIFDGRMYFPAKDTIAWSDNLFAFAPIYGLFWSFAGKNSLLAYNLTSLFTYTFAGVAAFILINQLIKDWKAALIGAFLFNMSTTRTSSMAHLQLNGVAFMFLAISALLIYFERRTRIYLILFALSVTGAFWSATYYFELLLVVAPVFILWWLFIAKRDALTRRTLHDFLWAGLVFAVTFIPTVIPYLRVQQRLKIVRPDRDLIAMSWNGFFELPHSWFYELFNRGVWGEHNRQFPGLVALVFASFGMLVLLKGELARRRNGTAPMSAVRKYLLPFIASAFVAVLLMQGARHGVISLPFRLMRKLIPGIESLRELTRLWVWPQFVVCLLAAFGLATLFKKSKPVVAGLLATIILAASGVELLTHGPGVPIYANQEARQTNRVLADLPPGPVAEYPVPNYLFSPYPNALRQLRGLDDNNPRYLGYTGYEPPELFERIAIINALPDPRAVAKMQQDGIRYVVIYGGEDCDSRVSAEAIKDLQAKLSLLPGLSFQRVNSDLIVTLPNELVATPVQKFPAPITKERCERN